MNEREELYARRKEAKELFDYALNRLAKLDVEYDKLVEEAKDTKLPHPM